MIFPIVLYGDPVLKKKTQEVVHGDEWMKDFVKNMFETMYVAHGVGLAASQVGQPVRLFIADTTRMEDDGKEGIRRVFINPQMIDEWGDEWVFDEGCLSIPGIRADVSRKSVIKIKYFDEKWEGHEGTFDGMVARVIQHEYDHLEGKLFIDYLTPFKRRLIRSKLANISKGKTDVTYTVKVPG